MYLELSPLCKLLQFIFRFSSVIEKYGKHMSTLVLLSSFFMMFLNLICPRVVN